MASRLHEHVFRHRSMAIPARSRRAGMAMAPGKNRDRPLSGLTLKQGGSTPRWLKVVVGSG